MKYSFTALIIALALAILVGVMASGRNANTAISAEAESMPITDGRKAVLVELFTSEGCSSCPPADDLLIKIEKGQQIPGVEIIAMSEHVDYWNRLGWTDPFSSSEFSARQSQYGRVFRNDSIYTPQMVVDGRFEFVGSNSSKASNAIAQAAKNPKANIQLTQTQGSDKGHLQFNIRIEDTPAFSKDQNIDVMLAITESGLQSNVPRGENAGRKLIHTAVVRKLARIGSVDPSKGTAELTAMAEIEKGWSRDRLRAVVFIQERETRYVLGAAALPMAKP